MTYSLKGLLDQGEPFVPIKGLSDIRRFAGQWIVLESNCYYFSDEEELLVAYVAKKSSFKMDQGRSWEGYELYPIRSGTEGDCFCSASTLERPVCNGEVWQEGFLRARVLKTAERARISHYLDEHAEFNAQRPDSQCLRLICYSRPRRVSSRAVFGFE